MGLFSYKTDRGNIEPRWGTISTAIVATVAIVIVLCMAILPVYGVWQKELDGKAQLAEAEWSRQIAIQEANARFESAKLDAKAEIERAFGVAEANRIIGDSLVNNTGYLHYLWIQGLHDDNSEVVYVPTELNLPLFKDIDVK